MLRAKELVTPEFNVENQGAFTTKENLTSHFFVMIMIFHYVQQFVEKVNIL